MTHMTNKAMKMLMCIIIFMMIISMVSLSYADSFSIRNGITFGLSEKDIIKIEKHNAIGVEPTKGDYSRKETKKYHYIKYKDCDLLGFSHVYLSYVFDRSKNDTMEYVQYEFCDSNTEKTYEKLLTSLTSKYGDPDLMVSSDSFSPYTHELIRRIYRTEEYFGISNSDCMQWLETYDDCAVLITAWYYRQKNEYAEKGYIESCYLFYNEVDLSIIEASKIIYEEYIKEEQEKEQKRLNDI